MERWRILVLTIIFCLSAMQVSAENNYGPTVRVGWFLVDGLQEMDPIEGTYDGYNYVYLKAIAQFTGWQYRFVPGTFAECMERLEKGEIDLVGSLMQTPERDRTFLFPTYSTGLAGPKLVTKLNGSRASDLAFDDFSAFNGLRAGYVENSLLAEQLESFAKAHAFQLELVPYKTQYALLESLKKNEVDMLLLSGQRNLKDMRILAQLPEQQVFFVTTPDKEWIRAGLDDALARMQFFMPNFDDVMAARYFSDSDSLDTAFTQDEKEYLQQRIDDGRPVLVSYDPAWMPVEYRNAADGTMQGLMKDIFRLLSERTGLTFRFVTAGSYAEANREYQGTAEVFSTLSYDFDWSEKFDAYVTQPVFTVPIFQVYNNELAQYNVVALPRDYHLARAAIEYCQDEAGDRRSVQGLHFVYYDTVEACLEALRDGKAGRTYINAYEVNYYIDLIRSSSLVVQSAAGFSEPTGIGVSKKADPRLFSILCRALRTISRNEINTLILSQAEVRRPVDTRQFIAAHPAQTVAIAAVFIMLVGGEIFFYYTSCRDRRQREELERANSAKSEFLSRISHDIRTPMNAILGMTELARRKNDSPAVAACLDKIDMSNHFLLELINDILDLSVIESGHAVLHPEPYALAEFRQFLSSVAQPLAEKKQIHFVLALDPQLTAILVDKLRFNRVFLNLLSNAMKFTPAGGTVSLKLEQTKQQAGKLFLTGTVADTGIGIPSEFLPRIFEPFTQADEKHIQATEGSGLGLAIVRRIVESFGGTITVKSEIGKGTVFTVTLQVPPAAVPEEAPAGRPAAEDIKGLAGRRILVVEDNAINQEVVCELLGAYGILTEVAGNGRAALTIFSERSVGYFNAILMDIRMPVMDGIEATKQLRALARADAKTIPIVALTADAYLDERARILASGMTDYLAKPVQPDQLLAVLQQVLQ